MGDRPVSGDLLEFTIEAETRPMATLNSDILNDLQHSAYWKEEILDPVFELDESTGSVSVVCQVDAASAADAAYRGSNTFLDMLEELGVTTDIERLNAYITQEESS